MILFHITSSDINTESITFNTPSVNLNIECALQRGACSLGTGDSHICTTLSVLFTVGQITGGSLQHQGNKDTSTEKQTFTEDSPLFTVLLCVSAWMVKHLSNL